MKATIWHNPKCGTSRKTLAILENLSRLEVEVIEYLKHPPTADKLRQLYRDAGITPNEGLRTRGTDAQAFVGSDAGITPNEGLRTRGTDAQERGLVDAPAEDVLAAMAAEPSLIERPLVETEKGARLCRPQDRVLEIL
tara:strand:- start:522 stop:935 length:414 start_codon:yes stop_codon:yes gene_type:complete